MCWEVLFSNKGTRSTSIISHFILYYACDFFSDFKQSCWPEIWYELWFLQYRWAGSEGHTTDWFHCWETSSNILRGVQIIPCWCSNSVHISIVRISISQFGFNFSPEVKEQLLHWKFIIPLKKDLIDAV